MPRIIEKTLYKYDELPTDKAKEKAREWFRGLRDSSDLEPVVEDAQRMGELLGIDFNTHEVQLMSGKTRYDPSIFYSLGYSQGDFAAFDGTYTHKPDAYAKIAEETNSTERRLLNIAAELDALQKEFPVCISGRVTYHHYYGLQAELTDLETEEGEEVEITQAQEAVFKKAMKDFAAWIYKHIREEDEYQSADEQVVDAIRFNEYEFDEKGNRTND